MRGLIWTAVVIASLCGLYFYPQWVIDEELEKLCKVDGGVKVFEAVKLPTDQFRPDGYPVFLREKDGRVIFENWLGPDYYLGLKRKELKKILWVRLVNRTQTIHRTPDHKLLGQSVVFARSGGGIPVSEGDGKRCPNDPAGQDVIKAVFTRNDEIYK